MRPILDLREGEEDNEGMSQRIAAIIDRYSQVIARSCPAFTRGEWCCILDACNGWVNWAEAGETLMLGIAAEVSDAIELNGLNEKWDLSAEQGRDLVKRLGALSSAETMAVIERIERFWRRCDLDTDEAMSAAGIVPFQGSSETDQSMAEFAAGLANKHNVKAVVLWEFPETDHAAWIATGMGDLSYAEYQQRLRQVELRLIRDGHQVERCAATVREMLECLRDNELNNDPEGRSAAAAILWGAATT